MRWQAFTEGVEVEGDGSADDHEQRASDLGVAPDGGWEQVWSDELVNDGLQGWPLDREYDPECEGQAPERSCGLERPRPARCFVACGMSSTRRSAITGEAVRDPPSRRVKGESHLEQAFTQTPGERQLVELGLRSGRATAGTDGLARGKISQVVRANRPVLSQYLRRCRLG